MISRLNQDEKKRRVTTNHERLKGGVAEMGVGGGVWIMWTIVTTLGTFLMFYFVYMYYWPLKGELRYLKIRMRECDSVSRAMETSAQNERGNCSIM